MLSVERKLTHGNNTSLQIKNFVFFKLFTLVLNMQLFIRYTGSKSRSIIRTVALLWCRRTKLEITTFIICNTEYQDELIHVISECTCTVRQRDRFKNHVLPSYDMSLAQNLNSVDTYTWALPLIGAPLLTTLETTFLQVTINLIIKCINIYLALLNNTDS